MRICVIDESCQLHMLSKLTNCRPDQITALQNNGSDMEISHGTLCMALLIEALNKYRVADRVHITHFSVADNSGEKSYSGLITALNYCADNKVDIVSVSIGVLGRVCAKEMRQILDRMNNTVVVAAEANHFVLTYPAALPQVIGVKRALKSGEKYLEWVSNPADGIDLIADYPDTPVIQKLRERYNYWIGESNSILVPQICAQMAAFFLKDTSIPTKASALRFLAEKPRVRIAADYRLPEYTRMNSDDQIPSVLLPYEGELTDSVLNRVISLQKAFEREEYACSILSDLQDESDFENGWYTIDTSHLKACLTYYQRVVSDSLLLVLVHKRNSDELPCDLCVEHWMQSETVNLYSRILKYFS